MPSDTKSESGNTSPSGDREARKPLLVVEDNPVMVSILGRILGRMEIGFDVVENGQNALERCRAHTFDLILMDINMPGMNGMEATRHIRTISPHYAAVPIVAVTANLSDADMQAYADAGMTTCVKKPVNQVDLYRMIETHAAHLMADSTCPFSPATLVPPDFQQIDDDELEALNWEVLREYSAVMKGDFPRLLERYLTLGPDTMDGLSDAVHGGDKKGLAHLAHKLKSTSIVFGAESVSGLAAQLEACARSGDTVSASALLTELHICFERTNHVLKKRLTLMKMGM